LSRGITANKTHPSRITYTKFSIRCSICKKIQGRSKKFGSLYQLLYHINCHNSEDEITAGVTKEDVRSIVKHLCQALEHGMFLQ
jgi:hypothetical protein